MARLNNYTIEIIFDTKVKQWTFYTGTHQYYSVSSYVDKFSIFNNKIIIEASRSESIKLDELLNNHNSTLYKQIIKSLIFYYARIKYFHKIKRITVTRFRGDRKLDSTDIGNKYFRQVIANSHKFGYIIDQNKLVELFNETDKGTAVLITVSYLLNSCTKKDENEKFEKLWKAFNKLFMLIGKEPTDHYSLRNLREFIILNPGILNLSSSFTATITKDKLRTLRWREMILYMYTKINKTESLRDFILRYSDRRIMEIIKETNYAYREDFLRTRGYLNVVEAHVENSINNNIINDNEIVTFLTGKYMYFVRNKSFHGEKIDPDFKLSSNRVDSEMSFLNNVLEKYLIDLLNANNLY